MPEVYGTLTITLTLLFTVHPGPGTSLYTLTCWRCHPICIYGVTGRWHKYQGIKKVAVVTTDSLKYDEMKLTAQISLNSNSNFSPPSCCYELRLAIHLIAGKCVRCPVTGGVRSSLVVVVVVMNCD